MLLMVIIDQILIILKIKIKPIKHYLKEYENVIKNNKHIEYYKVNKNVFDYI